MESGRLLLTVLVITYPTAPVVPMALVRRLLRAAPVAVATKELPSAGIKQRLGFQQEDFLGAGVYDRKPAYA